MFLEYPVSFPHFALNNSLFYVLSPKTIQQVMDAAETGRKVGFNSLHSESETDHQVVVMAVEMDLRRLLSSFCRLNLSRPVRGNEKPAACRSWSTIIECGQTGGALHNLL